MSADESESGGGSDSGPGTREVAYRLFAAEFDDCDFQFSESDEERAPNYVITPTGGRVNRMFLVGVLTELDQVNETMLRARVVDPTGAFVVYAGQYQPEALSFLERTDPPAFLAVTGKARTYQPEDSDVVYSSVRPESISEVDAATRDRWVVSTAEQTLDRIGVMAAAIESELAGEHLREHLASEGIDPALAQGVALAREHYGTTPAYLDALRDLALDATRVVANEREEAGSLDLAPDEGGEAPLDALRSGTTFSGTATADTPGGSPGRETTTEASAEGAEEPAAAADTAASDTTASDTTASDTAASDTAASDTATTESATEARASEREAAGTDTVEESTGTGATSETASGSEPESTAGSEPAEVSSETGEELGEFEPGEFDEDSEEDPLGEEVREQVEEEYGTEFSTGTEVESEPELEPEPELEAESEPEPDVESEAEVESEPESEVESESEAVEETGSEAIEETPSTGTADESAPAPESTSTTEAVDEPAGDESAEEVDLSEAVMDAMRALDEGDGASREEVVARVADRTGASPEDVESAVQDALMGGQCYEPEDGRLKPI